MSPQQTADRPPAPRARYRYVLALLSLLLLFVGFCALGSWQVQRLFWKLALIERVEARVHAPPQAPPGRAEWSQVDASRDEYRAVSLQGRYLHEQESLVQAVTERGAGFWVLTPLLTDGGEIVLVNRGFVDPEHREAATRTPADAEATVRVTGLLRISEPGGGFLRDNDARAGRWYSRDVAAIAAAQGLPAGDVAPYFVDAGREPAAGTDAQPIGGLTVLRFHNSHLVYLLTWYGLALMVAGAAVIVVRNERRQRRG